MPETSTDDIRTERAGQPVIETRGLSKTFQTGDKTIEVLRGIDFAVEAGITVAVVGESGAGKSTLLHLLGTLEEASAGHIYLGGDEVGGRGEKDLTRLRNERIGFVFQFHYLLPEFTALENVMMPLLIAGESRKVAEEPARELLEQVGLAERLEHRPPKLSGGEQQRVAIARALVRRPAVVLADEPTGNLDEKTSASIHELFMELNQTRGMTAIVATHNRGFAAQLHQTLELRGGRLHPVTI